MIIVFGVFSLSNFLKSSLVYAASLYTFLRFDDLTWYQVFTAYSFLSLQNFKKPLNIFSPQTERKLSEEYLVTILAVIRKL